MVDGRVVLTAEEVVPGKDGAVSCYGLESIQIPMAGELRSDSDEVAGAEYVCSYCGEPMVEYPNDLWLPAGDLPAECRDAPDDGTLHNPIPVPLAWANSARISFDEQHDMIVFAISTGDPRGAFTFSVRRRSDTGTLVMEVPHPQDAGLHEPLVETYPGQYTIGG